MENNEAVSEAEFAPEAKDEKNEPPPLDAPNPKASPDLLARIWGKITAVDPTRIGSATEIVKCRHFSWELDGRLAAPGFWVDENGDYVDIRVHMKTLTSVEELEALSEMTPDGIMSAPSMIAKHMIHRIGSVLVTNEKRDIVWESLGPEGRRLAIMSSQEIGGPVSQAAMGKYRSTFAVE